MEPKCNFVQQDQKQQYFISTKLKNNVKVSKSEQILKYQIYICKQIQKFKTRLSIFNNTYNSIQQFNRWVLVDGGCIEKHLLAALRVRQQHSWIWSIKATTKSDQLFI